MINSKNHEKGGICVIVTIGRTYGSDGREIGRQLARRLNIPFYAADAPGPSDQERIRAIQALADEGACVIVGFCADHVLAGRRGLIRVFVHSGMASRVARIAGRRGISPADAEQLALSRDRERAMVYGRHTRAKWADLSRYDLTVDSGPLGTEDTVELLCQFIALKVMRNRPGGCGNG